MKSASFILYLFVGLTLVLSGADTAFCHDLESLRSLQQKEFDAIDREYSERARKAAGNPDGTVNANSEAYRKIEAEYFQKLEKTRNKYSNIDPRLPELQRIQKEYKGLIKNSGSGKTAEDARIEAKSKSSGSQANDAVPIKPPKDVRADLDLTATSDEAARKLAEEWKKNGDFTVTYDPKTGKYVSTMNDATIWEPATPERQKARMADSDAFVTPGGKKAVGVTGPEAMIDPLGYALDNKQKFQHAHETMDMKTMGKSLSKAAENVGHTSPVSRQANDLRNYKTPNEAGITKLGESSAVQERKTKDWVNKAASDFEVAEYKAQKKSEQLQEARRKMADKVEKTSKGSADQNWKDQLGSEPGQSKKSQGGGSDDTAQQIKERADMVDQANADAKKRVDGSEHTVKPDSTQKSSTDSDASATKKAGTDTSTKPGGDSDMEAATQKTGDADKSADANPKHQKSTGQDVEAPPKRPEPVGQDTDATTKRTDTAGQDVDVKSKAGDVDTGPKPKSSAADVDGPHNPAAPSGGGKIQQGLNAADKADMILQGIEIGTTVIEGIKEGDASKAVSPLVGQDSAERVKMKGAYEWANEEGKALDSKTQEVASEIEAKLRRMGASKEEARKAREQYESNDRGGFHESVARIKEKGQSDTKQRAVDAGGPIQEEDGAVERLKEGGKQAGKYVDSFYGGLVEKTETSVEERKKWGAEQDQTQRGIQENVDNQVVKKMMRMGVPYEEARKAMDLKRSGDSSEYNKIVDNLQKNGAIDPKSGESGLETKGLTDSFEGEEYWKEIKDNMYKEAERKGAIALKPFGMIAEWQEETNLEEMRNNERAAKFYQVIRAHGVPKDEALAAARDYAENENSEKIHAIYRKYIANKKKNDGMKDAPDTEVVVKNKLLVEFLLSLNHKKMEIVFEKLDVKPSQNFYNCLCRSAGYGSPGTSQYYHPDTIGEYNPKYSCNHPGDPCVVSGFGCMRYPMPSAPKVWEGCMAKYRLNVSTGEDGKEVPGSGERLDDLLLKKLRERKKNR